MESPLHVGCNGIPAQQHNTSEGNNKVEQWYHRNYLNKREQTVHAAPPRKVRILRSLLDKVLLLVQCCEFQILSIPPTPLYFVLMQKTLGFCNFSHATISDFFSMKFSILRYATLQSGILALRQIVEKNHT